MSGKTNKHSTIDDSETSNIQISEFNTSHRDITFLREKTRDLAYLFGDDEGQEFYGQK